MIQKYLFVILLRLLIIISIMETILPFWRDQFLAKSISIIYIYTLKNEVLANLDRLNLVVLKIMNLVLILPGWRNW